jgi:hypothetical protein
MQWAEVETELEWLHQATVLDIFKHQAQSNLAPTIACNSTAPQLRLFRSNTGRQRCILSGQEYIDAEAERT